MAGRKSKIEELKIVARYSELTAPYFKALKGFLESDEKADRRFALEQLTKAFTKMIPQDVTTGGEALPAPILSYALRRDDSNPKDTKAQ